MGEWSAGWADRCFKDAMRDPKKRAAKKRRVALKPGRGAICLCDKGFLGMITHEKPTETGVWIGIYLEWCTVLYKDKPREHKPGDFWQSCKPKVLAKDLATFVGKERGGSE